MNNINLLMSSQNLRLQEKFSMLLTKMLKKRKKKLLLLLISAWPKFMLVKNKKLTEQPKQSKKLKMLLPKRCSKPEKKRDSPSRKLSEYTLKQLLHENEDDAHIDEVV
jgi:hypothetical protein